MKRAQSLSGIAERYPVDLYLALHRGTPGDREFYAERCRDARSVLELGCGDARLLSSLGSSVVSRAGVDHDPEMLARARARASECAVAMEFHLGDMVDVRLPRRFARVLIPFSGLFCLRGQVAQLACLQRAFEHLEPGGRLILDVYSTEALWDEQDELIEEPDEDEFEWVADVTVREVRFAVYEQNAWWPSRQELHVRYRYESVDGSAYSAAIEHFYLHPDQLNALLQAAGFGEITWHPLRGEAGGEQWAVEAIRPLVD